MPSIKKADIIKINSKCENGFRLDIERAVVWGEKDLRKGIEIANTGDEKHDNIITVFTLSFDDVYEGEGWRAVKIGVAPTLTIDKQFPIKDSTLANVVHVAKTRLGDVVPRKSMATLQKLTGKFTDEICCKIYHEMFVDAYENKPQNVMSLRNNPADVRLSAVLEKLLAA